MGNTQNQESKREYKLPRGLPRVMSDIAVERVESRDAPKVFRKLFSVHALQGPGLSV